jgi:RimJ/RimL family protein N-acetyltransferase
LGLNVQYLTGERVALRAMKLEDKEHASAWFDGPFPIDATRAEEYLRDVLKNLSNRTMLLALVRIDGDELVGGARAQANGRHAVIRLHMAPWLVDADELRGDAVRLLVPWLRDEGQHITVTLDIAVDQPATVAAAESAGMVQTARFREWYARPGGRADRLVYEALNPFWERSEEATGA